MIVLDANILIRAILGRRVRELIEMYAPQGVRFFAPDEAFEDARKYLPGILEKCGKQVDVASALEYLQSLVETIDRDVYGAFEDGARQRLRGRDEDDWPALAVALGFACAIWTEDANFFGTGVAVWTTNRVEIFLREQARLIEEQDE